jgi:hypothetical protein
VLHSRANLSSGKEDRMPNQFTKRTGATATGNKRIVAKPKATVKTKTKLKAKGKAAGK